MSFKSWVWQKAIPFVGTAFESPCILPVIYYHDIVDEGNGFSLMRTEVAHFEEQMNYLAENSYKTLLFSELPKDMKKLSKEKSLIITFDDGFASNYEKAFPIIKKLGIKINIFLVYDYLDTKDYLTTEQIHEMRDSGLVEFGYHTKSHCDSRTITNDDIFQKEIIEGLDLTEKILGTKIEDFCFPFGYYDKEIVNRISDSNVFERLYTSNYVKPTGIGNCVVCGRIGIDNAWDIKAFEKYLQGKYRILHYYSKIRVGIPAVK